VTDRIEIPIWSTVRAIRLFPGRNPGAIPLPSPRCRPRSARFRRGV